jgi:hypothetical protein
VREESHARGLDRKQQEQTHHGEKGHAQGTEASAPSELEPCAPDICVAKEANRLPSKERDECPDGRGEEHGDKPVEIASDEEDAREDPDAGDFFQEREVVPIAGRSGFIASRTIRCGRWSEE